MDSLSGACFTLLTWLWSLRYRVGVYRTKQYRLMKMHQQSALQVQGRHFSLYMFSVCDHKSTGIIQKTGR